MEKQIKRPLEEHVVILFLYFYIFLYLFLDILIGFTIYRFERNVKLYSTKV